VEIGGYRIPRGASILLSPFVTHRREDLWENPEGFDPDRFLPDHAQGRPRYAYFPFGGGPRTCIGMQFALTEAKLVLATLARRVRLDLLPGHPVVASPMVTLRPRYGIRMSIHARRS
jgi:cytochrome P450